MIRLPRWVLVVLLVISILFTIAGIAMIAAGAEGGWVGFLFFGLCSAIFVTQLRPDLLVSQKPEPPAVLLRRFPGPVELRMQQFKLMFTLLGVLVFGGITVYFLRTEQPGPVIAAFLWLCVACLAVSVPFFLYLLIKGGGLSLERDGFRVMQAWRTTFTRWADTSDFDVGSTALLISYRGDGMEVVTYDDSEAKGSGLASINASIVGKNSALPDTYGYSAEDLKTLMNGWRERALAPSGFISPPP
jgi:hypothetical protein